MALFKDGERIDLKTDKDYLEKKKWIEDNIGFPVVFKRRESWITTQVNGDGESLTYAPPFIIPNVSTVVTEDGREEWRWCPIVPKRDASGEYKFPREFRTTHYTKRMFSMNKNEMDKIYYLYFKDSQFKAYYEVDDAKGEADAKLVNKIKEAKIYGAFYGENSVLLNDKQKLRKIARAWNISRIESMTDAQILAELEEKVRNEDKQGIRTVDEFLESTQLSEYIDKAAIVQQAEDVGAIIYDEKTSFWFYSDGNGTLKDKLCEVSKQKRDHKYEILRDFLDTETAHLDKLRSLTDNYAISQDVDLNFEDLEHEDWSKVMEYCNLHNIKLTAWGRQKTDVLKDVKKHHAGEL